MAEYQQFAFQDAPLQPLAQDGCFRCTGHVCAVCEKFRKVEAVWAQIEIVIAAMQTVTPIPQSAGVGAR